MLNYLYLNQYLTLLLTIVKIQFDPWQFYKIAKGHPAPTFPKNIIEVGVPISFNFLENIGKAPRAEGSHEILRANFPQIF